MFALFQTLFDIIRLRKGPDAIPHSTILLSIIVALWLFAGLLMTFMTEELDAKDFVIGTVTGLLERVETLRDPDLSELTCGPAPPDQSSELACRRCASC